jgi:hypothetical protein
MGIIALEFDNTLKQSDIIVPLVSSSKNEAGEDYNDTGHTDVAQTSVFGVLMPLIMINNTVIDFDSVQYFSLKSTGRTPELMITVDDKYELINNIDKIGQDNEVRVQILPKFDNAYKKINLTFYITNTNVMGSQIQLTAVYKVPALMSSEFKSYGSINTYNLFKTIATETELGFASNIVDSLDSRYIYCNNMNRLSLMENEIQYSAAPDTILDWWIDLWNNINLADIRERYEAVDPDDDIKVWIGNNTNNVTADVEIIPEEITAVLTDLPGMRTSELFVKKYENIVMPGGQVSEGSDKVYSIYNDAGNDCLEYLVQDGDIKNDIITTFEYVGEFMGEYNYMLSKNLRTGFFQKMNSEIVNVTLKTPLLGLMRGHKVNFVHYVNDSKIENKMKSLEDEGLIDRNVESNVPLSEYELEEDDSDDANDGKFKVDKTVSGQYLITGVDISYSNMEWDYKLTLAKSAATKPNLINNEEEYNG